MFIPVNKNLFNHLLEIMEVQEINLNDDGNIESLTVKSETDLILLVVTYHYQSDGSVHIYNHYTAHNFTSGKREVIQLSQEQARELDTKILGLIRRTDKSLNHDLRAV